MFFPKSGVLIQKFRRHTRVQQLTKEQPLTKMWHNGILCAECAETLVAQTSTDPRKLRAAVANQRDENSKTLGVRELRRGVSLLDSSVDYDKVAARGRKSPPPVAKRLVDSKPVVDRRARNEKELQKARDAVARAEERRGSVKNSFGGISRKNDLLDAQERVLRGYADDRERLIDEVRQAMRGGGSMKKSERKKYIAKFKSLREATEKAGGAWVKVDEVMNRFLTAK